MTTKKISSKENLIDLKEIFLSNYQNRYLLSLWVIRDLRARYAGSAGGFLWAVGIPIFTIALYFVFFSLILQVKIPQVAGNSGYFFYLLAGLIPWLSISEALNRSASCLVDQREFLRKVVFPIDILPSSTVIVSLVPQIIGTLVYMMLLAVNKMFSIDIMTKFFLVFICQVILMFGLSYLFAALGAIFPDFIQAMAILMQLWFYSTPILYPRELVPDSLQWILYGNPLAPFVYAYQAIFLGMQLTIHDIASLTGWTFGLTIAGLLIYSFLRPALIE